MKNTFIILIVLCTHLTLAQNNCDHDVSTDPLNPTNSALPVGTDGGKYRNSFNWFPVTQSGLYDDYPCTNIHFAGVQYQEMNNILLNALPDYNYLKEGPLPLTKNGWELLLVNLGRFPDDITPITAGNQFYAMPYIVIYNRYSGIIRVFVNFGLDHTVGEGADAIEVVLTFENAQKLNGIYRLNEGIDQSLDQNTDVKAVSSICKAPAFGQQWASTDVRVAYDPCVCYFPSKLQLQIRQLSSSTLELHGRSITLEDEPLVNNTTLQVNPAEYLTGFDYNGKDAKGGGIVMHKSIVSMINDYEQKYAEYNKKLVEVNEHNVKVKRNLAVIRAAKFVVGFIDQGILLPTPQLLAEKAQEEAAINSTGLTQEQIDEAYEGLGVTTWWEAITSWPNAMTQINNAGNRILNTDELFKTVAQIFGEKGSTFIANNFIEQAPPNPPTMPTATFSEMHYSGKLGDDLLIGGPEFYTPGSYGSTGTGTPVITNVYEYPVYNEILGTFALLETPKISIWESGTVNLVTQYKSSLQNVCATCAFPYYAELYRYKSWKKNYEIKLKNDLKYVFNTALDIKSTNVQVSFDIVAKPKKGVSTLPRKSKLSVFNNGPFKSNTNSNSINLGATVPVVSYGQTYYTGYSTPDFDESHFTTADLSNELHPINLEPSVNKSDIKIQTPYFPVNAFYPVIGRFGLLNEFESYEDYDISTYDMENTNVFYGAQSPPYTLNMNSSILDQADDFNPVNGYEYDFEIEMKLIVDMEFNTLNQYGQTNKVTQLLTYKIDPSSIIWETNPMSGNGSVADVGQYPFDLPLGPIDFHGQQVTGCVLTGNTYVCQAMNDVEVNGNLSTSNGYKAYIRGGNQVIVFPEANVSPEVTLEIVPVLDYAHAMPAATSDYLTGFCNGTNPNSPPYRARSGTKSGLDIEDIASETDNGELNFPFNFNVFPNPTTGELTVQLNQALDGIGVIVTDISGKRLDVRFSNSGNQAYRLNLDECSPGIYFVTVSTFKGTITKQVVKR